MNSTIYFNNGRLRNNNTSSAHNNKRFKSKQKARNQLLTSGILFFAGLILIIIISGTIFSNGNVSGSSAEPIKTYKSLVVERGDTLWDIAKSNANLDYYTIESYIKEVKSINGIKGYNIFPCDKLILPVLKNTEYYSIIR